MWYRCGIIYDDLAFLGWTFRKKLDDASMKQSLSRIVRCIDNGPKETFWGILKSEIYYLKKFDTYENLKRAIVNYIDY